MAELSEQRDGKGKIKMYTEREVRGEVSKNRMLDWWEITMELLLEVAAVKGRGNLAAP